VPAESDSREALLGRVLGYAAREGIADRSLRAIAAGAGTSHRMLLYHFGSREGLLVAIVAAIEARQRAAMAELMAAAPTTTDAMRALWKRLAGRELRPFVRLFFEVVALASRGEPATRELMRGLTRAWLDEGAAVAERLGRTADAAAMRLAVAVARGLLLDLLAGAPRAQVDAAHELFVGLIAQQSIVDS
jgi:AcrR family transcriptional regulator